MLLPHGEPWGHGSVLVLVCREIPIHPRTLLSPMGGNAGDKDPILDPHI